ncbi:glycosyltransferase family 8 protein [Tortispora caseinolytica NRRL Y-17796]|uniref:Glycosyltransferase family 8 protein n=1 Tax=Tortispora caseinolytica NRRL Y-17796 TaxID=767744 RepID=A0A1E4TF37_9ASCO|nr:glycosyltransferase family 8 protein [Tortispora caseinolytica NRRL Y-17796]
MISLKHRKLLVGLLAVFSVLAVWTNRRTSTRVQDKVLIVESGEDELSIETVDWSRVAYVTYATSSDYLCNAVILTAELRKLTQANIVTLIEANLLDDHVTSLLTALKQSSTVVEIDSVDERASDSWDHSFVKLHSFNLTQFDRIVYLDCDALLLKPIDYLFLLPWDHQIFAHAYWTDLQLGSYLMVLSPSTHVFNTLWRLVKNRNKDKNIYDMDILSTVSPSYLYDPSHVGATKKYLLPAYPNIMLTGELKTKNHNTFLKSRYASQPLSDWPSMRQNISLVHFSDWPDPKPWVFNNIYDDLPVCDGLSCSDHQVWISYHQKYHSLHNKYCPS